MGPLEWIKGQAWKWLVSSASNSITTSQELEYWLRFGGQDTDSGIAVTVNNAPTMAAFAVCLRVLTDDVSQLPLSLMRVTGNLSEPAKDKPLYRILHNRPNYWQASCQFRNLLMRDLLLRGNAYALKTWRGKDVIQLLRIHPDAITPKMDDRMNLTYECTNPDGSMKAYRQRDILHIWKHSDDGVKGLNPIEIHRNTIGDGIAFRKSASKFLSNASRPSGVLEMAAGTKIGPEAARAMLSDYNESYQGTENAYKTALLPGGVSFKPISVNMQDAQYLEIRKKTDRDVYGIFGVPPHKGGDLDQAAVRANVESENISYVVGSLMPWLVCIEQCILRDCVDESEQLDYKIEHNVNGLLRGDATTRAAFHRTMVEIGAENPNEVRQHEGMNPRVGGDEYKSVNSLSPSSPIQPKEPQQGNG